MATLITRKQIKWTRLVPRPDPQHGCPCARSSHGLSIVQKGSRLVLLGGEHVARTPLSREYWAADLVNDEQWQWRLLTTAATNNNESDDLLHPPDRIAHAQAAIDDQIYVFGGRAGVAMQEMAMNDLWKLDCSGPPGTEEWSRVPAEGAAPDARSFHRMIAIGKSLYVFGGCGVQGRLAGLHRFDVETSTWHALGASPLLRGRGGPNLLSLNGGTRVGVVAGFCGEETADGHVFTLESGLWDDQLLHLEAMRPRSVCVSGSFPSLGYTVIFGGEVDPSDRGHEGAGGFEKDLVVLDETNASWITSFQQDGASAWPPARGWSDAATLEDEIGQGRMFVFGGLAGDDENPKRLDDLWMLEIEK